MAQSGDMKEGFNTDRATFALQRAIEATFDESRWYELGYYLGNIDIIQNDPRLLRSLYFGDSDYGASIFRVLTSVLGGSRQRYNDAARFVGMKDWLKQNAPELIDELYDEDSLPSIVSLESIEQAGTIHSVFELNKHAARIRKAIDGDPEQALGSAKELLETVLKTVIGDHALKPIDDIHSLLKKARAELDLDPKTPVGDSPAAESLRRTLSSLGQVVVGVAEVRNLYGTGHGRSHSHELEVAHVRLVVNAAISMATFLLEVWQDRQTEQSL